MKREPHSEDEVNYWFRKESDINKIETEFYNSDEYKELKKKGEEKLKASETFNSQAQQTELVKENDGRKDKSWWQRFIEWLLS